MSRLSDANPKVSDSVLHESAPDGPRTLADVEARMSIPLVHAMETQRAIRRLRPDPVDMDLIIRCLELALKAPSGSNDQSWQFIVVTDAEVKAKIGDRYRKTWKPYSKRLAKQNPGDTAIETMLRAVQWQIDHFEDVPVVVIPCLKGGRVPFAPTPFIAKSSYFGSVYPSVQNLLLAARSVGLGANIATGPMFTLGKMRRILGLPRDVTPMCIVPMGWPIGRYGTTTRVAVGNVVHFDQYDNQPQRG